MADTNNPASWPGAGWTLAAIVDIINAAIDPRVRY